MAKLVDALRSGRSAGNGVLVRVQFRVLKQLFFADDLCPYYRITEPLVVPFTLFFNCRIIPKDRCDGSQQRLDK